MSSVLRSLSAGALLAAITASGAFAGGHGEYNGQCYRQVTVPAEYAMVAERVMVTPAQRVQRVVPAEVRLVRQRVMVQPARRVTHVIPAEYDTVSEKVLVRAERMVRKKEWRNGEYIMCDVREPAVYALRERTVLVSPERRVTQVIPAEYDVVEREVVVRPQRVVHDRVPAVYETRHRQVLVRGASTQWQAIDYCKGRS